MKKHVLLFVAALATLSLQAQVKVASNGNMSIQGNDSIEDGGELYVRGSITRADIDVMPGGKLSLYNRTNCKLILDEGDEVNIAIGAEFSFNGGQIFKILDL